MFGFPESIYRFLKTFIKTCLICKLVPESKTILSTCFKYLCSNYLKKIRFSVIRLPFPFPFP